MNKPSVLVTRQIFPEALALIAKDTTLEVWPNEHPPSSEQLHQMIANVQGVLTNVMDKIDGELLNAAPNIKVISQMAVGLDNIDVAEATRRGIPVGNTPGVLAKATADLAFTLLMAAARRICEAERWVRQGDWNPAFHPLHWLGVDIHGATLGIIGLGQIGKEMAKRSKGFDMKILYFSRTRKPDLETQYGLEYTDLPTLLAASDFISLHIPLTPETRHFIAEDQLRMMKPSAILINVSRGPIVDPKALYVALKDGWIKGAGLDVTEPEPIPINDPLLTLENLVVTPHIGSASISARRAMSLLAAQNLLAGLKGDRLVRCANPEVYEALGNWLRGPSATVQQ
jgi:glyoxylate reductase